MFVVDLKYIAPLEQLDAHMTEHVHFLNKYYKLNVFLTSGRKIPRTGGIILAVAGSKEIIEEIMREDPFCKLGLAEVRITEFRTSQFHPEMKKMIASLKL